MTPSCGSPFDARTIAPRRRVTAGPAAQNRSRWGERAVAERALAEATPAEPLTDAELAAVVKLMGDLAPRLAVSDPAKRAKAYDALGVRILYTPASGAIELTVRPPLPQVNGRGGRVRVEGGICAFSYPPLAVGKLTG